VFVPCDHLHHFPHFPTSFGKHLTLDSKLGTRTKMPRMLCHLRDVLRTNHVVQSAKVWSDWDLTGGCESTWNQFPTLHSMTLGYIVVSSFLISRCKPLVIRKLKRREFFTKSLLKYYWSRKFLYRTFLLIFLFFKSSLHPTWGPNSQP